MTGSLIAGTVVVWWMAIDAPEVGTVSRWRRSLDLAEQARADRFYFAADRETYIGAHALKRELLASVGDLPASAWRFIPGPFGKPNIDPALNRGQLRFNLSHTRGLVACAVAIEHNLGLDVETWDRVSSGLDVAERYFAPSEAKLLRGTPAEQRPDTFVRIWTLKEAYIKATGQGLSCPLDGFEFGLEPVHICFGSEVRDDPSNWQFVQRRPTTRHYMALALHGQSDAPVKVVERKVSSHEL